MLILRQRKATHALASKKIGRGLACGARRGAEGDMPNVFAKGQAYVALSRVKTLAGLAIKTLDPKKLLDRPHDECSLTELKRLRDLQQ